MAKDQFQSAEHIEIRLSPFTSRVDGTEVVDDTTVTLKITKPNGDALADVTLLRATGATVVDPNTGMWKYQLNVSNYAPGTWLVKALSSGGASAFNQRKVYTWGDYVDDITVAKTQATNAASSASSADGKCTTIAAVTSALPTFPSDPASQTTLDLLEAVAVGKWVIDDTAKQLILYQWSGGAWVEFKRFDLFDKTGAPASSQIYSRVPV